MNRRILLLVLLLAVVAVVGGGTVAAQSSPATWFVTYYNNENVEGDPVYTTSEGVIDHDWGRGVPAAGVNADHWSARWTTYKHFEAGTYRFTITSDDGARVFLGDKHIHVDWEEHGAITSYVDVSLTGGRYPIAVDYFDDVGNAELAFGWQRTGAAVAGAADVTVIRRGTIGGTPSPAPTGTWRATYWNNRSLSGSPVVSRNEVNIDYNWGNGAPAGGVNRDNWSARWTRRVSFGPGTYRFHAVSDDGVRVWIGDRQIINEWSDHAAREATATVTLSAGTHPVTVEFYEHGGEAVLRFWWEYAGDTTPGPTPSGSWHATYWNNRNLQGSPAVSRNEAAIDYNWGNGAPVAGVGADNWSARWTRNVYFPAGTYRFTAISDDGVRVIVADGQTIEDWSNHAAREATATVSLAEGTYPVTVEYYEHTGEARLHVSWQRISDGGTGTGGISAQTRVNLRLRAGPGTSYTILDVVPTATIVPIIARTESGDWIQVQYRGRLGWMYRGLTTVYGDLNSVPVG